MVLPLLWQPAALNALKLSERVFSKIKVVCVGAGAAGIACLKMLISLGVKKKHIWLLDTKGLITSDRTEVNSQKSFFAQDSDLLELKDVIKDADLFLGLSGPNILSTNMILSMKKRPIIFALANPNPEIIPEDAKNVVRPNYCHRKVRLSQSGQ